MYHYTLCGLPYVYLNNGYTLEKTPYGEGVSIQDLKGLHKAIGLTITESPSPLSPKEIRFVRKEMDLSQKTLADLLAVKSITVRKWESGDNTINGAADRLLRALYQEATHENSSLKLLINRLAHLDSKIHNIEKLQFTETESGWQKSAA
jgi:putative transcriptional regulator